MPNLSEMFTAETFAAFITDEKNPAMRALLICDAANYPEFGHAVIKQLGAKAVKAYSTDLAELLTPEAKRLLGER